MTGGLGAGSTVRVASGPSLTGGFGGRDVVLPGKMVVNLRTSLPKMSVTSVGVGW